MSEMTPLLRTAIVELASVLRDYDRCNPDVGFGYPDVFFIKSALQRIGLRLSDQEMKDLAEDM